MNSSAQNLNFFPSYYTLESNEPECLNHFDLCEINPLHLGLQLKKSSSRNTLPDYDVSLCVFFSGKRKEISEFTAKCTVCKLKLTMRTFQETLEHGLAHLQNPTHMQTYVNTYLHNLAQPRKTSASTLFSMGRPDDAFLPPIYRLVTMYSTFTCLSPYISRLYALLPLSDAKNSAAMTSGIMPTPPLMQKPSASADQHLLQTPSLPPVVTRSKPVQRSSKSGPQSSSAQLNNTSENILESAIRELDTDYSTVYPLDLSTV